MSGPSLDLEEPNAIDGLDRLVTQTPETLTSNGSFIDPGLAVAVQSAASEGDIWKIIATIMPIYGMAVLIGLLAMILKRWAGQDWTLRTSLRAAFYMSGTLTTWMILSTAIIDLVTVPSENYELMSHLYVMIAGPTIGAIIWMYSGFFYNSGALSKVKSALLGGAMFVLIVSVILLADLLIRL